MPPRLQIYVLTRTLAGVGAALAVVSAVIVLVDLVELSRTVGSRGEVDFAHLLELTLLKPPSVILLLLPFVFLFGAMGAFVALNRRGELVAMRAAGMSAWSFIRPAAMAALLIGVVSVAILNPLAARLNARFEDQKWSLISGVAGSNAEIWLRQGDGASQTVIHAKSRDSLHDVIRLKQVSIFIQTVNPSGGIAFDRRIEADQALLMPGEWRLFRVREVRAGLESVRSETLSLPSPLDRRSAMETFVSPGAVAFWDLPATIRSADLAGYSSTAYRLHLQQLIAIPVLLVGMTVLAASFSLRLIRMGTWAFWRPRAWALASWCFSSINSAAPWARRTSFRPGWRHGRRRCWRCSRRARSSATPKMAEPSAALCIRTRADVWAVEP
jgi:lipopolysaccharide export system permease protein